MRFFKKIFLAGCIASMLVSVNGSTSTNVTVINVGGSTTKRVTVSSGAFSGTVTETGSCVYTNKQWSFSHNAPTMNAPFDYIFYTNGYSSNPANNRGSSIVRTHSYTFTQNTTYINTTIQGTVVYKTDGTKVW